MSRRSTENHRRLAKKLGQQLPNSCARFRRLFLESLEDRRVLANVDLGSDLWQRLEALQSPFPGAQSYIQPAKFASYNLNATLLKESLAAAPLEFTAAAAEPLAVSLPAPTGGFQTFSIVEAPIMEPALAAEFPEIRTYRGQSLDDSATTVRFDVTPAGFHAQVLSPSGVWYVDPYWHLSSSQYISYFKRDLAQRSDAGLQFEEEDPQEGSKQKPGDNSGVAGRDGGGNGSGDSGKSSGPGQFRPSGTELRTYRLATAATGEYTGFFGGTVDAGQAAIVTAINRVTGIYEVEVGVRLVLVANNSSLVYTNAGTDPYTNNDGVAMLGQNQTNIDAVITSANYDIGHVFSTGGGGVAGLRVVGVDGFKARGVTGSPSPVTDAFYVDYVAHEMGHQFGGNHTFNGVNGATGGSNRNAATAYEPGSGSTIQAYAGIAGADDLQSNSDPYFHSVSLDEIINYTTSGVGNAVHPAEACAG